MYKTRLEIRDEFNKDTYTWSYVVRRVFVQNVRLLEINNLLKPKYERLEEIQTQFSELDMYSIKYIGQDMLGIITDEQKEKWLAIEQEKQDLRDELNDINAFINPLLEEMKPLIKSEKLSNEEYLKDLNSGKLKVTPDEMQPFIPSLKERYLEAYANLEQMIADGKFEGKKTPKINLSLEEVNKL